jgi:Family of unknown function (DUF6228)
MGREDDGLQFSDVERGPDGEIWYVYALWRGWMHLCGFRRYATAFDELARFFRGLAADRRGWPVEATYESLEHELRLTARHDSHVCYATSAVARSRSAQVARPTVPRILLPSKITVKGARAARRCSAPQTLERDLARQTHWHLSGWTGKIAATKMRPNL